MLKCLEKALLLLSISAYRINFISEYIEKPPKSFKNISDRANELFIHHIYNKKAKKFQID